MSTPTFCWQARADDSSKSSKLDQNFELGTETFFHLLLRRFNSSDVSLMIVSARISPHACPELTFLAQGGSLLVLARGARL